MNVEAALERDALLTFLDFRVVELFDSPALEADEVIVMPALVQLEDRLAALEMVPLEQPRLLELRQHAIHRGKPDLEAILREEPVDVVGAHVAPGAGLEQTEYAKSRQRRFQAAVLEILGRVHESRRRTRSFAAIIVSLRGLANRPSSMCEHRRIRPFLLIVSIAAVLSGCKSVPMLPGLTTYRIDIQQGNVVTQDMIDKLKPGMTRHQVRFVMGTPPIADPFHKDRWDYVYYLNRAGKVVEHRRLILLFDGDVLKRVEGDVVVGAAKPVPDDAGKAVKPQETTAAETRQRPQDERQATPY